MANIKIGSHFFRNELKEYSDWHWAYVREAAQNCLDANGSSVCSFDIQESDGTTTVVFANDGEAMTETVLVEKLLALGESGKRFEGSVGGFGKAKTLLYLAHQSYTIRTGTLEVVGSGGEYEITRDLPWFDGTRSTVVIPGNHSEELGRAIQRFITYAQWPGTFHVNGAELRGAMHKGSPRRDLGFGVVYSNRSHSYTMVVRINGTPMFMKSINLDRCVVVELKGRSDEVLTANRDGLREPYGSQLGAFVTELAVDKRSALKNRRNGPRYIQYRGTKMCHRRALDVNEVVQPVPVVRPAERPAVVGVSVGEGVVPRAAAYSEAVEHEGPVSAPSYTNVVSQPRCVATLGTNFILKNETDLKVPAYYDPGSGEFSEYSRKLVRIWGRIMVQLHRLFDTEAEFSIGFVFDEEGTTEAEHEQGDFGKVYYLNPAKVVEQRYTSSKSFQKRFKLTERDRLVMIGVHEFVHGLGFSWHDERYANKLTDVAAKVMKERSKFNWCFN